MARLLDSLRAAGAQEQVAVLLHRDPAAHVRLDDPARRGLAAGQPAGGGRGPAGRRAGVVSAAHVPLDDLHDTAKLLDRLRAAGADEQVAVLGGRLQGEGMFELFRAQEDPRIGSCLAGRLMAAQPSDGIGEI